MLNNRSIWSVGLSEPVGSIKVDVQRCRLPIEDFAKQAKVLSSTMGC
jgi:hypothetical protein